MRDSVKRQVENIHIIATKENKLLLMLFMVSWKLPIAIVGSMVPTLVAVIVSKKNAIPSASGIGGRKKKKRLS